MMILKKLSYNQSSHNWHSVSIIKLPKLKHLVTGLHLWSLHHSMIMFSCLAWTPHHHLLISPPSLPFCTTQPRERGCYILLSTCCGPPATPADFCFLLCLTSPLQDLVTLAGLKLQGSGALLPLASLSFLTPPGCCLNGHWPPAVLAWDSQC